jgi:hypothetical protein
MNSKFALFFFFQEKVIGKINTPEHHSKNGIFMEFFARSDGWCCGLSQPPQTGK